MIAIIRTRTLRALRTGVAEAESAAETARTETEQHRQAADLATDSAIRAETVVEDLLRSTAAAVADAVRAEQDTKVLRQQLAAARPATVFVLLRYGNLHGIYRSRQAARQVAEKYGADPAGWFEGPPGEECPCGGCAPAREIEWQVKPVPLADLPGSP
ncbi:hypothetical protein [Streptomyces sp. NPDC004728]|uniref:hypothetical protein n=1 Tax=Streptomyces sp. NPDC004728 TaxID=3154289 RepID=UPI0033B7A581